METAAQAHPTRPDGLPERRRSNRSAPVEQWPESVAILRHLATHSLSRSIRDIATAVQAPEISTRNRLIRLEAAGALSAHRSHVATPSGKPAIGMHYRITQFGRDCASHAWSTVNATTGNTGTPGTPGATAASNSVWGHATSVFAWGAAATSGR